MIFLFLSVAAVCATALCGFRMYLKSKPVQAADFAAMKADVAKLETRLNKLNLSGMGRGGG